MNTTARRTLRWVLVLALGLFFGVVLADALGLFAPETPYRVIHHPTHSHYIPKECPEDVSASLFPTQPPGPDERITCEGRVVPK